MISDFSLQTEGINFYCSKLLSLQYPIMAAQDNSDSKESACSTGDPSLIPDWEDPMEKGMNGNPLHYSCLENSMDREAWQGTVHSVTESDAT